MSSSTAPPLPAYLRDQILQGNVILFLGSGFSIGAKHPLGNAIPTAVGLSDLLVEKFLDARFKGRDLGSVSSLAISESDLFAVQNFVYNVFQPYQPSDAHIKLASFKWKSIYTTNYDLLLEEAYQKSPEPAQTISPVFKNTKDYQTYRDVSPPPLPYYKLHGCLNNINDADTPLILSPDQYLTHRENRQHLYNKFFSEAWNYTVVFIGFSFMDWDIMSIVNELDSKIPGRSRYYCVSPFMLDTEIRHWEKKRITPFIMTYDQFIDLLEREIPEKDRKLATLRPTTTHPIQTHYLSTAVDIRPTALYETFLLQDIDYVHAAMNSELVDPKDFYKGHFESWDPIIRNFDVRRSLTDTILTEIVLEDYYNNEVDDTWLFLIRGYGGSGKTVFLKRLAWEITTVYNKLCIFYKKSSRVKFEYIRELFNFTKKRIYIFVDDAVENEREIINLIKKTKTEKIPITIFSAGRTNLFNTDNLSLKSYIKQEYDLEYLNRKEIQELLVLLERNKSLGHLQSKSQDDRIKALEYKQGYELLVTLYEATHGESFEKILVKEFDEIPDSRAQSVYLTVSIFHRLRFGARAGLISRVHRISSSQFSNNLALPLQHIVFDHYDYRVQDYLYQTRHPYIAELLIENILDTQDKRFDEYMRILEYLDVDFENDRVALSSMTNAKKLLNDFSDHQMIRLLYDKALKNNLKNPRLLQQIAIFHLEIGEFDFAETKIKEADESTNENDPQIKHTYSEIAFKRAERSYTIVEKRHLAKQCIHIAEKNFKDQPDSPYPAHTILKAHILLIDCALVEGDDDTIERCFKEFERRISNIKQKFASQEFILTVEASFNELIKNKPEAIELLQRAHKLNPGSPFITSRLVKILRENRRTKECGQIIELSLRNLPGDKDLNLLYAEYLIEIAPNMFDKINHHLSRSYTENDSRHYAQYLHAKSLFLGGDAIKATQKFKQLLTMKLDPDVKRRVSDLVSDDTGPIQFTGKPKTMNYNHGWITRDKFNDEIYYYDQTQKLYAQLKASDVLSFNIGFTYGGPTAVNIVKKGTPST